MKIINRLAINNAAAGIMVGGKAKSLSVGIQMAKEVIDSGLAKNVLKSLAAVR